jgi:hypothetical protein
MGINTPSFIFVDVRRENKLQIGGWKEEKSAEKKEKCGQIPTPFSCDGPILSANTQ